MSIKEILCDGLTKDAYHQCINGLPWNDTGYKLGPGEIAMILMLLMCIICLIYLSPCVQWYVDHDVKMHNRWLERERERCECCHCRWMKQKNGGKEHNQ
jgi:hypothetical protein